MNIGRSRFQTVDRKRRRVTREIFSIDAAQRSKHVWVLGKTGVGKSTFLENAILQDIRADNGLALFDPHGSLKDKVLSLVPPRRINDVVLFDPSDHDFPIGFNIFDAVPIDRFERRRLLQVNLGIFLGATARNVPVRGVSRAFGFP